MKFAKLFRINYIGVALALSAFLSACSSQGELYEEIPMSAQAVVVADLTKIADNLGIKVTDGGVKLPSGLSAMLASSMSQPQIDLLARLSGCIDAHRAVAVVLNPARTYVTVDVTDDDSFVTVMRELAGNSTTMKGYDVYDLDDSGVVLARDGRAWLSDSEASKTIDALAAAAKEAKDGGSLADVDGLAEALDTDRFVTMALNWEKLGGAPAAKGSHPWAVTRFEVKQNRIEARMAWKGCAADATPAAGLDKIDPAMMRYTPSSPLMAMAVAVDPGTDWEKAAASATNSMDFNSGRILAAVMPFLGAIDGTVTVTVTGDFRAMMESDFSLGTFGFTIAAQVKPELRDSVASRLNSMVGAMGFRGRTEGQLTRYAYEDLSLVVGLDGDVVVMSTRGLPAGDFDASAWRGKGMGLTLNLPPLSFIAPGLPDMPSRLSVTGDAREMVAVYEIPGLKKPILQYLTGI